MINLVTPQDQSTVHPVGGRDRDRFDPQEAWYPIFYLQDLDRAQPNPFTLLDRDLVVWWEENSQSWRVFEDCCPHRLAPLSQGRINEAGQLECPYHGWAFSGEGHCEIIPQQLEGSKAETSQRACVAALPTAIYQGMLFVYPGNPENAPTTAVPVVEPLEDAADDWVCIDTFRDLPYDALTLLENVLDSSHLPFTHHRSVGNRANAAPVELEVVESTKQGFTGVWEEGPRRGKLGRQDTTFIAPGLMWHDLTSKQFGRTLTVVYATPIRKGECRIFARFPFKFPSKFPALIFKITPRWYSHIGQNAILEDDQIFLYFQERYLEKRGGSTNFNRAFYLPTKADRFVTEFRNWVNRYQADPFPTESFSPPKAPEQLLDRYHSHTEKCASCRGALQRIQQLRLWCAIVGAIAWICLPLVAIYLSTALSISLTALSLGLAAAWLSLARLERKFYEGRAIPPRNLLK
ncbi:Rieske 2Fe-2S domain-containing protein [Oscillatoria sp. FACHB-1406]|uniref:Rieske 2Fe-2S domain-containing protein n=1 Tax=Oscillatoria sp. FACHB-1406 TaxID=2692846 RepID=UPI0016884219|nr:Rieske 2Fe-2S domain-containing protein [Oscillatoria sp. FACHB-1406]MBD2577426.1 Rieske 2Fe-2S domain-containing protein [Oscillatoria sp. FACHB-1406]